MEFKKEKSKVKMVKIPGLIIKLISLCLFSHILLCFQNIFMLFSVATLLFRIQLRPLRNTIIRSQWPRGIRHELSSLAWIPELWVRIPLKAWVSVYVYSTFVLFCVQVAALRRADAPSKESYWLCKKIKKLKMRQRSYKRAVEPHIDR
jgi:hypothetical protein